MAADDFVAEDRGIVSIAGNGCIGSGIHVLHRPSVQMVRASCGGMGEFKDGIFHFVVMCFLRLVSAIGRVVHLWDDVGVHLWSLERVSYIVGFLSRLSLLFVTDICFAL